MHTHRLSSHTLRPPNLALLLIAVFALLLAACETKPDPSLEIAEIDLGETEVLTLPQSAPVVDLLEGLETDLATDIVLEADPASGEILIADETLAIFDPAAGFDEGEDSFRFRFTANGQRYIRRYRIRMLRDSSLNRCAMIFRPDRAQVGMNARTTIPVLANDPIRTCAPGTTITRMGIRGPRFGSAQVNANRQVVYAPPHDYTGRDYLVYYVQLSDGTVGRSLVWLNVQ